MVLVSSICKLAMTRVGSWATMPSMVEPGAMGSGLAPAFGERTKSSDASPIRSALVAWQTSFW